MSALDLFVIYHIGQSWAGELGHAKFPMNVVALVQLSHSLLQVSESMWCRHNICVLIQPGV